MSNILPFKAKNQTPPADVNWAAHEMDAAYGSAQALPRYAALPKHFTASPVLRACARSLQDDGFRVMREIDGVFFAHPTSTRKMNFSQAMVYQMILKAGAQ
jgi:hypothetical protein